VKNGGFAQGQSVTEMSVDDNDDDDDDDDDDGDARF
jgi:hypothetical protein